MALFSYTAKDINGQTIKGRFEAKSREDVIAYIKDKKHYPISIEEEHSSWNTNLDFPMTQKVKLRDLALFCRQFATTLYAGITVVDSINILRKQTSNKRFSQALGKVYDDLLKGNSLSFAMSKEAKVFPYLLINMVETGEISGNLDGIMDDMANHFEKKHKLNQKIKSALTYPIILSTVALVVVIIMITFVMPTFVNMFDSFGAELPAATKVLLSISYSLKNFWFIYLILIGVSGYLLYKYLRTPKGKILYHRIILKLPVFGPLNTKIVMERFASTISLLLSSGVDILQAMEIVQKVVANVYIEKSLFEVRDGVRKGFALGKTMEATGSFPPLIYQMVEVGENSGTLDFVLKKVADFYQTEVETAVTRLTTMIEPIIILVLGLVIGYIVISMVLPIFDLYNVIG